MPIASSLNNETLLAYQNQITDLTQKLLANQTIMAQFQQENQNLKQKMEELKISGGGVIPSANSYSLPSELALQSKISTGGVKTPSYFEDINVERVSNIIEQCFTRLQLQILNIQKDQPIDVDVS